MIYSIFSVQAPLKVVFVAIIVLFVSSCGTYQPSSYYGEDGIYGSSGSGDVVNSYQTNSPENKEHSEHNGKYYKDYFSKKAQEYDFVNDENMDVFTDVNAYSSVEPEMGSAPNGQSSYGTHYGEWGDRPATVNLHIYSNPHHRYFYWSYPFYYDNYYYNSFYSPFYYSNYYGTYGHYGWRHHYYPYYRFHYPTYWGYHKYGYSPYRYHYPYSRYKAAYVGGRRNAVPSRRVTTTHNVIGNTRSKTVTSRTVAPSSRSYSSQTVNNNSSSSRAIATDRRASYRTVENRTVGSYQKQEKINTKVNQSFSNKNSHTSSGNSTNRQVRTQNNSNSVNRSYQSTNHSNTSYRSGNTSSRSYSTPRSSSSSRSYGNTSSRTSSRSSRR